MQPVTDSLPLLAFHHMMCAITQSAELPVDMHPQADTIQHPAANSAYLTAAVAQYLEKGMAAILQQMAERHATIASGKLWDEDGYLPANYKPGQPVRMLGEWLRDHNPYQEVVVDDPRELDWSTAVPWDDLSLERQFKIVFHHLDKETTGCVLYAVQSGVQSRLRSRQPGTQSVLQVCQQGRDAGSRDSHPRGNNARGCLGAR